MTPFPPDAELSSWKQIAAYLGVGVRTAQGWERERGLPVHRLPGPRGVVSARVEELAAWRKSATPQTHLPPNKPTASWWQTSVVVATLGGLLIFALGVWRFWPRLEPVSARVEEHAFVVMDQYQQELWRIPSVASMHALPASPSQQRSWVGDLDGDGSPEVLYGRRDHVPSEEQALICYANDGRERWRFTPNKTIRTKETAYPPPYGIHSLAVTTLAGKKLIAVSSYHYPYAPARVTLLTAQGKVLAEYWHFGHLFETIWTDLDGSGRPLLYLGGISNQDHAAVLIVLDPATLRGESQGPTGPFLDIPRSPELARVVFPRSEMNERFEPYNGVALLDPLRLGLLVHVKERYGSSPGVVSVMYHLNATLGLHAVGSSDTFTFDQTRLFHEGILHRTPAAELERIATQYRLTAKPLLRQHQR